MPRIEFDGQGVPVPSIALPPFGSDSDLPPTVLTFAENAEFSVTDYKGLGFTHFEVWCVGGAGGRGSDATSQHSFATETVQRPVPQDVWNLRLEEEAINDYYYQLNEIFNGYMSGPVVYNRTYNPGERGYYQVAFQLPQDRPWTAMQAYEAKNPYHLLTFKTTRYAILWPTIEAMGGGGGGGGLHKAAGALTELADTVPIVVGKAGVDAGYAQTKQPGAWTPVPPPYQRASNTNPYGIRREDIRAYLSAYTNIYPQPQTTFPGNPVKGPDGDTSSFAGSVCQASGGEGGGPGAIWDGTKFVPRGHGGRGGLGGRLAPGGGAAGSTAEGVNGSDGIWLPETGIGSGGGGGKGGRPTEYSGGVIGGGFGDRVEITHLATAGGQGSYSYADTTVYGQRQFRQPWTYMKPSIPIGTSTFIYTPTVESNNLVVPGGGGGARPFPNMKYGGRGIGFSPNGIVVLRLTKITS